MNTEDESWLDYRERFSKVYDASNYQSPLQSFAMNRSHRLVEKEFLDNRKFSKVLEIGAGTGEHLAFVRHEFDSYLMTDLDEKALEVARLKNSNRFPGKINYETQSAGNLVYPDDHFDRIIASHILEHIYQPHLAIKEWIRVLKNGGVLSILIPTDPGIAWRLGRHLGPRRRALAQGFAYDYIMAREHVNSCNNLIALLRHYFPAYTESWWPLPIASIDLNLFFAFHAVITKAKLDAA